MLTKKLSRFNKIVLWGYNEKFHSHKFIHLGYQNMLKKLGVNYLWLDDNLENNKFIEPNDLVMIPDVHLTQAGKTELSHKFREDVFYLLHPGDFLSEENWSNINPSKVVKLYEFRKSHMRKLNSLGCIFDEKEKFVYLDRKNKIILQPWGTDLGFKDFLSPIFPSSDIVYFIGSIWGDKEGKRNGNFAKVNEIKNIFERKGLKFEQKTKLTFEENIKYIRESKVSFSIGAIFHNEDSYLQCRMFKNIAYGQPTITDVQGFKLILKDSFIDFESWEEGVDKILNLGERGYKELCVDQQEKIKNYSYENMWLNMIDLLD